MTNLPMLGLTHGKRSAVTCHLKCDSQCARPDPNSSTEPTFAEIAGRQLTRRAVLAGGGALAAAAALPVVWPEPAAAAPKPGGAGPLAFTGIDPVSAEVDTLAVPAGYHGPRSCAGVTRCSPGRRRSTRTVPTPRRKSSQFGYNNDYLDILVDPRGRTGLLCCNHEYTNRPIMFGPTTSPDEEAEVLRTLMAAHGFSVVELERRARKRPWRYVRGGRRNRRITASTAFRLTGPAAGSATAADRRRPDRPPGVRHLRQLLRRHHARGARSCPVRRTSRATSGPTRRPAAASATA